MVPMLVAHVGPLKRFRMKKQMWAHIAARLTEKFKMTVNAQQVESRYKCILKRTKKAIDNNNTSGSSREVTEYDDEIRKIVGMDDSICPDFVCAPGKMTEKTDLFPTQEPSQCSTPSPSPDSPPSTDSSSAASSSSSLLNSGTPRRQRKTAAENFFQSFLEAKAAKDEKILEFKKMKLERKMEQKREQEAERNIIKQKRHEEKMLLIKQMANLEK